MNVLYVGTFFSKEDPAVRSYGEDLADRLEARGAKLVRTSSHRGRLARLGDILATAWLQRDAYDIGIINVFSGAAFVWAEAVCFQLRRLGKPYVLALHGGALPAFAERWPRRVARLLRSASSVNAPSTYLARALRGLRDDIEVIPNALDLDAYTFRHRPEPRPSLVWLRAFHSIYNAPLALDVVADLMRDTPDISLTMVGPDRDGSLAATRAHADSLGVSERVQFVPGIPRNQVSHVLSNADIFLNTTDVDNTPVSVVEAAACGLCIVSTNVGGIPHLLRDAHDALLVPPRERAAMADALRRVLREDGLAGRISSSARHTAEQRSWNAVLPQWDEVLTKAIRASPS